MFGFLKRRKFRTVRFAELTIDWKDGAQSTLSILFNENDNGERKYEVKGRRSKYFKNISQYAACEIWAATGLFPEWAKDPLAEKLSR